MDEELLAAARGGDGAAFARLAGPLRGELHAHCYRMLGSVHDADDVVQEALDRAWRAIGRCEGRFRPWLYKIATNRALTLLERRGRRELPADLGPGSVAEVSWLEPYPERKLDGRADPEEGALAREAVELAFVAALQHLSPIQRAVVLLRDVLGHSARETAELLDTTPAAVNSAHQRARKALTGLTPETSQRKTLNALGEPAERDLVRRYVAAWEHRDIAALVSLLTEDVRYSMPPLPAWYQGEEDVRRFLLDGPFEYRWRFLRTRANGQLAFGTYLWEDGRYRAAGMDVLTLRGARVAEVVSFLEADLTEFGLPHELR